MSRSNEVVRNLRSSDEDEGRQANKGFERSSVELRLKSFFLIPLSKDAFATQSENMSSGEPCNVLKRTLKYTKGIRKNTHKWIRGLL